MNQDDLQDAIQARVGPMGGGTTGGIGRSPGTSESRTNSPDMPIGLLFAGLPRPDQFDPFTAASSVGLISVLITRSARSSRLAGSQLTITRAVTPYFASTKNPTIGGGTAMSSLVQVLATMSIAALAFGGDHRLLVVRPFIWGLDLLCGNATLQPVMVGG